MLQKGDIVEHDDGSIYVILEVSNSGSLARVNAIVETRGALIPKHTSWYAFPTALPVIGHVEEASHV